MYIIIFCLVVTKTGITFGSLDALMCHEQLERFYISKRQPALVFLLFRKAFPGAYLSLMSPMLALRVMIIPPLFYTV
jgi:hypothetical protein